MPSRIVREGILTSEAVDKLSPEAEVFYRRLHSVVDDHGLYHAHPQLLRAHLYPLRLDRVTDKDIRKWIKECTAADLVYLYSFENKPYLRVNKFDQQVRQKRRKFPEPTTGGNGEHA